MNEHTLYQLLECLEWKNLELKESRSAVPDSVYETVSAFLNTEGGHIVLGVNDKREIVGVIDVEKIQGDFIGQLNDPQRFGNPVSFQDYLQSHEDKNVLIFYIPEASRKDKPVYVKTKSKARIAFIRKGSGDYACNHLDLNRMINDAREERPDAEPLEFDPNTCFDSNSVKWFRARYESKGGNRSLIHLSDNDFLTELGLLVEQKGQLLPRLAAILLLGSTAKIRQIMQRPIVICTRYGFERDHANTGERWDKRITCEYNIVQAWQSIVEWYSSFADTPFKIDRESGQRSDSPPDFIAFRESIINLLSHQDFTDQARPPTIDAYTDLTCFWNPGDAFANADKLLEPSAKEARNPIVVRALRDIGFSEQSGWGLRDVYRNWSELGHVPPELKNDKSEKSFELILGRKVLMSEQQILLQSQIGIRLSQQEAAAFANLCAADPAQIPVNELRAALGLNGAETAKIVQRLIVQGVAVKSNDNLIVLSEHLIPIRNLLLGSKNASSESLDASDINLSTEQVASNTSNLSTEQVKPLTKLTDKQKVLLSYCDVPRSMSDIRSYMDIGSRGYFKMRHLDPLLQHGLLVMTNPEKPTASNQTYVITALGAELNALFSTEFKKI